MRHSLKKQEGKKKRNQHLNTVFKKRQKKKSPIIPWLINEEHWETISCDTHTLGMCTSLTVLIESLHTSVEVLGIFEWNSATKLLSIRTLMAEISNSTTSRFLSGGGIYFVLSPVYSRPQYWVLWLHVTGYVGPTGQRLLLKVREISPIEWTNHQWA